MIIIIVIMIIIIVIMMIIITTATIVILTPQVMADSGVSATVSVSLHPLVIMNISEHWTRYNSLATSPFTFSFSPSHPRVKAQEGKAVPVYGALIGKQAGRDIELMNRSAGWVVMMHQVIL